jgi:alcohol dehydrogenase (cytochrome c)
VRTGNIKWKHKYATGRGGGGMPGGIFTTASHLLSREIRETWWHSISPMEKFVCHRQLTSAVSNGPSTWTLEGKQYVLVGVGECLYAMTFAGGK